MMHFLFSDHFLWGTAMQAYQVGGNSIICNYWMMAYLQESPFVGPSGDACLHYHFYTGDIALLTKWGFNDYRVSLNELELSRNKMRYFWPSLRMP
jgi:beta-glucosidase/6-phospho-beta-glucosidase/beta-galactosidase